MTMGHLPAGSVQRQYFSIKVKGGNGIEHT